ncbi:lamin tail domain-containing protein [Candidatus Gracilibacteria bacterium]|nr:lamin tail domain-containing protein [Candidatus Gracilibacteria bacterium]
MYRFCIKTDRNIPTIIRCYFIAFFIILLFFPMVLWGKVEIYEIFPNTIDDTNLEYIELRNTGCSDIDISGYILEDMSTKQYIFPTSSIISPKNTIRIDRSNSKIILNNVDEILYLKQPDGTIEDQLSYSTSTKGVIIIDLSVVDEVCNSEANTGTIDTLSGEMLVNTGSTDSGNISSGKLNDHTGNVNPEITNTNSGELSGIGNIEPTRGVENTGSELTNTGTSENGSTQYNTGENTSTGIIQTGSLVLFPEIIPTLQNPTNATFTSGFFDCTNQNPCRINITLDPIFTGAYFAKDYTCTMITETGSIVSCNPNTLYFLTGGSLGFRLTSKLYPEESKEVFWNIAFEAQKIITEGEGQIIDNGTNNSGSSNENTGYTQTGEIQSEIQFPEIIPTFQSYTNATFTGNILTCTTGPCRLNFTLEPIFTGSFQSKDYTCKIEYGTGIYNTCNPSQLYLIGTGSIQVSITNKTSQKSIYKTFDIIQNIQLNTGGTSSSYNQSSEGIPDKNPPIIILEFDGKLKSYHEIIGENEINCYTLTCSINLSAERSYDPENSNIRYLWYYGPNDIKTTKDPGERKYGIGTHEIWLRVIDANNNVSSIKYTIHVLGNQDTKKEESQKIEKKTKIKSTQVKTKKIEKIKIKKSNKTIFFEPPEIILQKSHFTKSENGFICHTTKKSCSLNLTLSGAQKGIVYAWRYDNGELQVSKNPRSQALSLGKHTIQIIAGYSDNTPLWTQDISIQVVKNKKSKKIKVTKKTKKGTKKIIEKQTQSIEKPEILVSNNSKEDFPFTSIAILIGIFPIALLRKLILAKKKLNK